MSNSAVAELSTSLLLRCGRGRGSRGGDDWGQVNQLKPPSQLTAAAQTTLSSHPRPPWTLLKEYGVQDYEGCNLKNIAFTGYSSASLPIKHENDKMLTYKRNPKILTLEDIHLVPY